MVKVGPGKGRDGRIRVYFQGSLRFLNDLAKEQGVSAQMALGKWRREGEPSTVGEEFFEQARAARRDPERAKYYSVGGVRYSAKQMVETFGVNQSTLDSRRQAHGKTEYTMAEIAEMQRRKAEGSAKIGRSWGGRGPSEQPFGAELSLKEKAVMRLMAAW